MFGREAAAKHMLLAEESTKYVGDNEGILNLKLMQQLYHVVAYNLAKSRAVRDGNRILKRKNFKPKHLKRNGLVLVRDHTSKAFEPKAIDHHIVDFCGKNQVLVKDNHGNKKKVHVKDVKPIEMDIATAEFFRKEREQCTTRDAKHVMPIKLLPDLEWEFVESIGVMESDKRVTICCIREGENEDTQVTEVSEPKSDVKANENIEPVVTEAVEAPRATQTKDDSNVTEIEESRYEHRVSAEIATEDAVPREKSEISEDTDPRYEHRGSAEIATEDAVPREKSEISEDTDPRYEHRGSAEIVTEDAVPREKSEILEDADPRYEHREKTDTVTEDAVPREILKEVKPTENTGISQAILADPAESTEVSEQAVPKEIEIADTIDITEVTTGISEPTLEATFEKKEESTSPGPLQKENPKIQNNSEDTTGRDAVQVNKKTHKYPETNNSLVNKIFSVFRQAKESMETMPL